MIDLREANKVPETVGNKAKLLSKAAGRRLPVPRGVLLLDDEPLFPSDPSPLNQLSGSFAVRSAFSAEDRANQSMAGFFETELQVPLNEVSQAVERVRRSADRLADRGPLRRDVLIMEMVPARFAGVGFLQSDFIDDLINYTSGTGDKLVSGEVAGRSLSLQRKLLGKPSLNDLSNAEKEMLHRLQKLIASVRNLFGDNEWDIEWADDGSTCWLLQIRPITTPPRRNEAFTYANIREIMPDPPSLFMSTIVARSSADLFAYYRQFDSTLPQNRPMIEMFTMRPLFNISLLVDMMRWWGLPSSLVTNSIGGQADQESQLNLPRFLLKSPVLLKQGWAQLTAVGSSQKATEEILALAKETGPTLTENAAALQKLFVALVTEMFNLTAALSGPLLILRLTDTLSAHNRRNRTISTEMYTDLEPLRQMVAAEPDLLNALGQGDVPAHYGFQIIWQAWLDKHGRRGVYESDIARPRYHEDPSGILKSLGRTLPQTGEAPARSLLEWLTQPVWWQCQRVLSAREWWRYHSMEAYDILRQKILERAEHFLANDQLSSLDQLWKLTPAEWEGLEKGQRYDTQFWETRDAKIAASAVYDFPDLLYRMDDIEAFHPDNQQKTYSTDQRLKGVSLTSGEVIGTAWVLREPETTLPDHFDPDRTILIARSVDAGWIPTFSLVSGVAVEIGGDLSHGSIILREIGLPAVTNVQHLTRGIQTGDEISLKAGSGLVEILERKPM